MRSKNRPEVLQFLYQAPRFASSLAALPPGDTFHLDMEAASGIVCRMLLLYLQRIRTFAMVSVLCDWTKQRNSTGIFDANMVGTQFDHQGHMTSTCCR